LIQKQKIPQKMIAGNLDQMNINYGSLLEVEDCVFVGTMSVGCSYKDIRIYVSPWSAGNLRFVNIFNTGNIRAFVRMLILNKPIAPDQITNFKCFT
jgi:hypothetical protein